jgi:hypothetical protein
MTDNNISVTIRDCDNTTTVMIILLSECDNATTVMIILFNTVMTQSL